MKWGKLPHCVEEHGIMSVSIIIFCSFSQTCPPMLVIHSRSRRSLFGPQGQKDTNLSFYRTCLWCFSSSRCFRVGMLFLGLNKEVQDIWFFRSRISADHEFLFMFLPGEGMKSSWRTSHKLQHVNIFYHSLRHLH